MKIDLLPILDEMNICSVGCDAVIRYFGRHPIVSRRNLELAYDFRGEPRFAQFVQVWLGWRDSLRKEIGFLAHRARRSLERRCYWSERNKVREVWVSAVLAYIEEMNKP